MRIAKSCMETVLRSTPVRCSYVNEAMNNNKGRETRLGDCTSFTLGLGMEKLQMTIGGVTFRS